MAPHAKTAKVINVRPLTCWTPHENSCKYPAIMRALVDVGYKGFVGQEFVPKQKDKIASLEKCIRICGV